MLDEARKQTRRKVSIILLVLWWDSHKNLNLYRYLVVGYEPGTSTANRIAVRRAKIMQAVHIWREPNAPPFQWTYTHWSIHTFVPQTVELVPESN